MDGPARDVAIRRQVLAELRALHAELSAIAAPAAHRAHAERALNLAQFLALRARDRSPLQAALSGLGLARLGGEPRRVLATLAASLGTLAPEAPPPAAAPCAETAALLGSAAARGTRIMATLPDETASDPEPLRALLAGGADLVRINTARRDASHWAALVAQVRRVAGELGRDCPIYMDLQGPRLRSAPLAPGPRARRIRSRRGRPGDARECGHALLHPGGARPDPPAGCVPIPIRGDWSLRRRPGEKLRLRDARGARRVLRVLAVDGRGARVEARRTVWLETGGELHAKRDEPGVVGPLPPIERWLTLAAGDELVLHADPSPRELPGPGETATVGCTLPAALAALAPGERVLFDEGRIVGLCERRTADTAGLRVVRARGGRARLRGDRGINLPDTDLSAIPALGERDRANLRFIAAHADLVGLSFVAGPEDIDAVAASLAAAGAAKSPALIAKIETATAFRNLPAILYGLLRHERAGVMIARGDLAVELGYERLAAAQEEMLALCAAAGLPVIWATEVLDRLARRGQPTRSELTDAAAAAGADCVMLNKGPYLDEALALLGEILARAEAAAD